MSTRFGRPEIFIVITQDFNSMAECDCGSESIHSVWDNRDAAEAEARRFGDSAHVDERLLFTKDLNWISHEEVENEK